MLPVVEDELLPPQPDHSINIATVAATHAARAGLQSAKIITDYDENEGTQVARNVLPRVYRVAKVRLPVSEADARIQLANIPPGVELARSEEGTAVVLLQVL